MAPLIWITFGYFLGSVPFGLVITKALGLGDLRQIGSGNIGATNVLRTGNKRAAAATLILDSGKGAIAVLLALWFAGPEIAKWVGLAAFAGHCFPIWLAFKGGKGVATFLGTVLALHPLAGILCCASWLGGAAISRISSVGALTASALAPLWVWLTGRSDLFFVMLLLAALIWWRHKENLARLSRGEEPKMSKK